MSTANTHALATQHQQFSQHQNFHKMTIGFGPENVMVLRCGRSPGSLASQTNFTPCLQCRALLYELAYMFIPDWLYTPTLQFTDRQFLSCNSSVNSTQDTQKGPKKFHNSWRRFCSIIGSGLPGLAYSAHTKALNSGQGVDEWWQQKHCRDVQIHDI